MWVFRLFNVRELDSLRLIFYRFNIKQGFSALFNFLTGTVWILKINFLLVLFVESSKAFGCTGRYMEPRAKVKIITLLRSGVYFCVFAVLGFRAKNKIWNTVVTSYKNPYVVYYLLGFDRFLCLMENRLI